MGIEETMIELAAEAGRVKEVIRSLREERDTLKSRLASAERKLTDAFEHILLMCEWYSGHHGDAPMIFEEADKFLKRCIDEGREEAIDDK